MLGLALAIIAVFDFYVSLLLLSIFVMIITLNELFMKSYDSI